MPNKKQIKTKSRFKNSILSDDILKDSSKKTAKTNIPTNTEENLYELVFDKESSTPSNNKNSTKMVPKVTLKKRSKATPTSEKKTPLKPHSNLKTTSLVTSKINPIKRDKNITNDSLSNKKSNKNKSTIAPATSKPITINNNGSVKTKKTSNSVSTKKQNPKVTLVQFEKKSQKKGSAKAVPLVKSEQNKNSKTSNHESFKSEAEIFANNYFSMIEEISSFYISSWFDWFLIKE